ncbi:hypothetical protein Tco_0163702, partial [Tanacetum coccineum]
MSAMANATPIVTTVTKLATKEKTPKDADATPKVNIQDFCEEHYEDILPVIMDKMRRDKRKEVHARLDFEESPKKRRIREGSQNSSARTLSARHHNRSERMKVQDRLRYNDRHVLDRLGHRRQSAFNRLSDTYSPSTTKSGPDKANSRDHSHDRSHPHRRGLITQLFRGTARIEEDGLTWMTPIIEYLKEGTHPEDKKEASKLRIKARQYELWEGVLYRRSFLKPWLRCIGPLQVDYKPPTAANSHHGSMAILQVGNRHRWSFPGGTKKGQIFDSRYGLFHKVDRGESRVDNHWQSGEEVRVGQHSMPLRSPRRN